MKHDILLALGLLVSIFFISCGMGDVGSSSNTNNASVDNSVDNSQTGISSCGTGTSVVCNDVGPESFEATEQCVNVNGEPVVINGPEVVDIDELPEACPTPIPEPTVVPFSFQ